MTIPKEKAGNCCERHEHLHKSASDPAPEATMDKNKGGRGEGLPFSGQQITARWGMGCGPPPISAKFLRRQQEVTKTRTRAGMVQAWVAKKLVNVTFYKFFRCPI